MKKNLFFIFLLSSAATGLALQLGIFSSWDNLIQGSSDIAIVTCRSTVDPEKVTNFSGVTYSDNEVISVLKGDLAPGKLLHMRSLFSPNQGEKFLIFANRYEASPGQPEYIATEDFRIVPLNRFFRTNELAGKSLNEQIDLILRSRLTDLNEKMARVGDEKKRIELKLKINNANSSSNIAPSAAQETTTSKSGKTF